MLRCLLAARDLGGHTRNGISSSRAGPLMPRTAGSLKRLPAASYPGKFPDSP